LPLVLVSVAGAAVSDAVSQLCCIFSTCSLNVGRDAEGVLVCAEAAAVGGVVVLRALRQRAVACEVRAAVDPYVSHR
jgi:hypothetical protein